MKPWIVTAIALLALSTCMSAIALVRLSRLEDRPQPSARAVRVESPEEEKISVEVRQLREELVRLKEAAPRAAAAPAVVRNPEMSELLREPEALTRLWTRLDHLRMVRPSIGDQKFEQAALQFTTEGLELDARRSAAFAETARAFLKDLRRAAARDRDLFEDCRHRAGQALATCLDESRLHQLFKDRLGEWITYVLTEPQGE